MNANKNKGKCLEREIAKELTNIFKLNFDRVQQSGAFTGMKNSWRLNKVSKEQSLSMCGDIIVPIELKHVVFECKFYKNFSFSSLFDNNSQMDEWIKQATNIPRVWFIILKVNNNGKFIVFDKKYLNIFKLKYSWMVYKNNIVCRYNNFFEDNKDILLQLTSSDNIL